MTFKLDFLHNCHEQVKRQGAGERKTGTYRLYLRILSEPATQYFRCAVSYARSLLSKSLLLSPLALLANACLSNGSLNEDILFENSSCNNDLPGSLSISCVVTFQPGENSGFGNEKYPNIIYGPPEGEMDGGGSTDVLSLGAGGEIIVGFGANRILNGEGDDFIIFENVFYIDGDESKPFAELASVSVSNDGITWNEFPCQSEIYPYDGCAGWHVTNSNSQNGISPYDPALSGGDAFDLSILDLESAKWIKLRDLSNTGTAPTAGFDLDAITLVHLEIDP